MTTSNWKSPLWAQIFKVLSTIRLRECIRSGYFSFKCHLAPRHRTAHNIYQISTKIMLSYLSEGCTVSESFWSNLKFLRMIDLTVWLLFKSDFSKTQTGCQKPKSGKWKMDLSWNRIRFNLKTTIPCSFKIFSRSSFWKWHILSWTP